MGGAEGLGDRADDLLAGGRDDDDVASAQLVIGDQIGRLGEDQWVDDVVQRLADDRLDLFDVPPCAHIGDVIAHAVHLVVVGTRHQEEELGVGGLEYGASVN